MSFLDDITPDAGNPSTGMILGLLGGLGNAATPMGANGMGVQKLNKLSALFGTLGMGASGIQGGMQGAQNYRASDIANQMADINLQNTKALNPIMMNARMQALQGIQNPTGLPNGGNAPGSLGAAPQMTPYQQNALNMINSAQRHFGITGDDKPLTDAWKSAFEHDPSLAAENEKQKDLNSVQQTPNGSVPGYMIPGMTSAPGGDGSPGLFGSLAPALTSSAIKNIVKNREPSGAGPGAQTPPNVSEVNASAFQMPMQGRQSIQPTSPPQMGTQPPIQNVQGAQQLPPVPNQAQTGFAVSPPAAGPLANPQTLQALIAQQQGANVPAQNKNSAMQPKFKPDPQGMPLYNSPNTETGVAATKDAQTADFKANDAMSEKLDNYAQSEQRLNSVAQALKIVQSGGLTSQKAEIANLMQGLGINPSKLNLDDPTAVYNVLHEQGIDTLQELKQLTAGAGSRITNAEFTRIGKYMNNPDIPAATNLQLLGEAIGAIHYDKAMISDWQNIGGLGNREANGFTMRPADFSRQWQLNHNMSDFVNQAKDSIGPLKGMATPNTKQIQLLKLRGSDPSVIQQFEQKFGTGSAKQYLGGQ